MEILKKSKVSAKIIVLQILCPVLFFVCTTLREMRNDPYYNSFYAKAEIIMTEEEKIEYHRLPGKAEKEEFIREFWRKRDFNPTTEENDGIVEFQRRIDFADTWFYGGARSRGENMPQERERSAGWRSDRGRIYILMGPPDCYYFGESIQPETDRSSWTKRNTQERWHYERYNVTFGFYGGKMGMVGCVINEAMEKAKQGWLVPQCRETFRSDLRFMARFEKNSLKLEIPVTRVNFKEESEALISRFKIRIDTFYEKRMADSLETEKSLRLSEKEVMKMNYLKLDIPYLPPSPGKYLMKIQLEDLLSITPASFHTAIEFKYE